jgi:hypothetical protein
MDFIYRIGQNGGSSSLCELDNLSFWRDQHAIIANGYAFDWIGNNVRRHTVDGGG